MESKTYTLKHPVVFGSEQITSLRVRKPKARDLRDLPAGDLTMGHMMDLAAVLCDQPCAVINDLEIDDAMAVLEIVGGFMPAGLATGDKR